VRSVVESGSKILDANEISGGAKPQSPRARSVARTGKAGAKIGADGLPPFVQEVCPSAPLDIDPADIEQIGRVGRTPDPNILASSEDDAVAFARFDTAGAVRSAEHSAADRSGKPAIVVIHRRDFFRDCFVRCLEVAYSDRKIGSFATIAEWCRSPDTPGSVAAVIIVIEAGEETGLSDREFIERTEGKIPIIIVSDVDDLDHIVGALKRGARGYIPSSLPFNIAVEAVRLVEAGGVFVPASSLVERDKPVAAAVRAGVALTDRQMEVLEEIRHGKANKQIAYALKMSEHTVKLHLRHIMRKLNAHNRTEVALLSENLLAAQKDV
jgi:DNA-binding NarL/FixJ family response regulator